MGNEGNNKPSSVMAKRSKVGDLVLLLLLLLSVTTLAQLVPISSSTERFALLQLRSSLGLRARDWPRKPDPCLVWIGVECGSDGRVIGINVSGLRRTRVGKLNPQFSVDALANFTRLSSFNASGFALPGFIPSWFGTLFALQLLDLRSCSIVGSIPASVGNLTNLNLLYLSNNRLTGTIPQTLSQLSRLSVLDLSHNFLSWSIPPTLGNLSNLQILNLSNNRISGTIPAQLGGLSRLVDLDLGFNSLFGSVPVELRRLRSLQRMVVRNNSLTGALNENLFSGVTRLQVLVVSYNNLSGVIPSSLWSMPELRFLDVSYNNFSSFLPNSSSNADASIAVFNLSHNNFYGNLTSQLRSFSYIDLSDNYLEGKVSSEILGNASLSSNCLQNVTNQKSLDECRSFYAGRGLVFDNFGNPNATIPPTAQPRKKKSNRKLAFILGGVFVGLGFIVLLVLCLVCCLRRRDRSDTDRRGGGVGPAPEGGNTPPAMLTINFSNLGESFTYEQLLWATAEFNDSNLIKHGHSGDLFRGVLENGIPVVIKKVDVRSFKKESYVVELDLFSKASHARLVPLLGHCLEHENEKLLVYKYMPNGDLSNSLYRKSDQEDDSLQSLDWITRLKIAIGAAEGLSFLHHECNPPLVHRDVQASSILLDDKFEVRLGSLSELCTQEGDPHPNVITRLLRFPQVSEQSSSGSPSATCTYDVYCFGKVLLELVTGKLGISASSDAATNEWLEQTLPYINIYERELVTKIVDPSLIVDEDLLEEVWAMAIVARSCLNPKPSKRPLMRYILKALENPLKVVREENSSSARLRTTSSRGSWNAALFGSWRSSSDIGGVPGATSKEGSSSLKQSGTAGSQGSGQGGGGDLSSSNKKLSRDIFPEPADPTDIERREED